MLEVIGIDAEEIDILCNQPIESGVIILGPNRIGFFNSFSIVHRLFTTEKWLIYDCFI